MDMLVAAGVDPAELSELDGAPLLWTLAPEPDSTADAAACCWVAAGRMAGAARRLGLEALIVPWPARTNASDRAAAPAPGAPVALVAVGLSSARTEDSEAPAPSSGGVNELLVSLLEIAAATAGAEDLDRLLATIARELGNLFPVDTASVALIEADAIVVTEALRRRTATRRDSERLPNDPGHHMGWVINRGHPLWRNNIAIELRFKESLPRAGMSSDMTIPLRSHGRVTGAFRVACRKRYAYEPEDFEILKRLADLVAVAVENQRLLLRTRRMAEVDGLTGISNRRHFQEALAREAERARGTGKPLALVMMDVDHFKRVNDDHGHPAGDAVLRHVAATAARLLRRSDLVARYGGEEFALLLPGADATSAARVAENLRAEIEKSSTPVSPSVPPIMVTISMGVACLPEDGAHENDVLQAADQALYRAKREGRNRVCRAGEDPNRPGRPA